MSHTPPVDSKGAGMAKHIHESNLIEGINDGAADKQSMVAWDFLKDQTDITEAVILRLQKLITLSQDNLQPDWRGYFRKIPVTVGGHELVHWAAIPEHMRLWCLRLRNGYTSIEPKKLHVNFEKIHPFVDGNGRTGRMLMWWHEIKRGEPPTLILNSKKQDYYQWFRKANK